MRIGVVVLAAALAAGGPACAAGFVIPDETPARFDAYSSPEIAHPWTQGRPDPMLREESAGNLMARRFGLVHGAVQLFRLRVENAPSDKTMLDGTVDGGGIKLKLTW